MNFELIPRSLGRLTREITYSLYRIYRPYKVYQIRKSNNIKVLFVLSELSTWKTEILYKEMLKHDRFTPILGVTYSVPVPEAKSDLVRYLIENGYPYVDIDSGVSYSKSISPDIVFYQKPYDIEYRLNQVFAKHLNSVFCYCIYGFNTVNEEWAINQPLMKYAWKVFYENAELAKEHKGYMSINRNALVPTGLPMMDILSSDKNKFKDPWKQDSRKRIIFAPHHSIATLAVKGLSYGTFLDFADCMLEFAKKYSKEVQFAFKPHPILRGKLYQIWGKEKTDLYYNNWNSMENTHIAEGEYVGLFKYSDAMIHDCSSFQIEYHYTHNPVLFLEKDDFTQDNLSCLAKEAYTYHYKAKTIDGIEKFIKDVINGIDPDKYDREIFIENKLLPPNGLSACQNIINEILG